MSQPCTTLPEHRARCLPAGGWNIPVSDERQTGRGESQYPLREALRDGIKHGYETITLLVRYAPSLRGFYPMLQFLAEAAVAAQGYLIWPSVARSADGKGGDDWFMSLDV